LRELVSGATATIEIDEDISVSGSYFEDGTAKIEAWGETFDRTWEVRAMTRYVIPPSPKPIASALNAVSNDRSAIVASMSKPGSSPISR